MSIKMMKKLNKDKDSLDPAPSEKRLTNFREP
jgi:hypothetical protein